MPPRTSAPIGIVAKSAAPSAKSINGQRKSKTDSTKAIADGSASVQVTSRKKSASATDLTATKGPRPCNNKNGKDNAADRPKRTRARSDKKPLDNVTVSTDNITSSKVKSKLTAAMASMAAATTAVQNLPATPKAASKHTRAKQSTTPRANNHGQNGAAPATPQRKARRSPPAVTPSSASKQSSTTPIVILQRHQDIATVGQSPALPIKQQQRASPVAASPPSKPTRDHAYAGPTFSNSPAASRLPMPDILLNSNGTNSGPVPSLSPASSTTSLHQYSGYSAPPSPTRAMSGADLFANSNEYSTSMPASSSSSSDSVASFDNTDALRMRSRELLDMLRGSNANHPYGKAAQTATATSYTLPPPRQSVPAASYPCDPFYVGQPANTMSQAQEPYHFHHHHHQQPQQPLHQTPLPEWQQSASMAAAPSQLLPSTGDKMLINEMYSSNLRALLKIDVRA
ncbi:hypothetical protein BDF19DRAFT_417038 [Syncephalis fuscata]|nr:hypothetical protein BDF19DRAFT_417038 [Syncephalis fuscata]